MQDLFNGGDPGRRMQRKQSSSLRSRGTQSITPKKHEGIGSRQNKLTTESSRLNHSEPAGTAAATLLLAAVAAVMLRKTTAGHVLMAS